MVSGIRRPVYRCRTSPTCLVLLISLLRLVPSSLADSILPRSARLQSVHFCFRDNSPFTSTHHGFESFSPLGVRFSLQPGFLNDLTSTTGYSFRVPHPELRTNASTQTRFLVPPSGASWSHRTMCRQECAFLRSGKEGISQESSLDAEAFTSAPRTPFPCCRRRKAYPASTLWSVCTPGHGNSSAPGTRWHSPYVCPSSATKHRKASDGRSRFSCLPVRGLRKLWEPQNFYLPLQDLLYGCGGKTPLLCFACSRFGNEWRQTVFEEARATWKPHSCSFLWTREKHTDTTNRIRRCLGGGRPVGCATREPHTDYGVPYLMQWTRSLLFSMPCHKVPVGMQNKEDCKQKTATQSFDSSQSELGDTSGSMTSGEEVAPRQGLTDEKIPVDKPRASLRRRETGQYLSKFQNDGLHGLAQTSCREQQRAVRQGPKNFASETGDSEVPDGTLPIQEENMTIESEEAIRLRWNNLRKTHHEKQRKGGQTLILGIETSCDDTCVGIVDWESGRILANICTPQPELLIKYGGVHPSEAAAAHDRRMQSVVRNALQEAGVSLLDIDVIAFTRGPGLVPCLSVGASAALEIAGELTEVWADAEEAVRDKEISASFADSPHLRHASSGVGKHDSGAYVREQDQGRSPCWGLECMERGEMKRGGSAEAEGGEARETSLDLTKGDGRGAAGGEGFQEQSGRERSWLSAEERQEIFRRVVWAKGATGSADEKVVSRGRGVPLVLAVNHLHGHLLSAGRDSSQQQHASDRQGDSCSPASALPPKFLALLVSGGHTFSCVVKACEDYHLHLRPKLFLVPARSRHRASGDPRTADRAGDDIKKGHEVESEEGEEEAGMERADEGKERRNIGAARIVGESRKCLQDRRLRVETPGNGHQEKNERGDASGLQRERTNDHDGDGPGKDSTNSCFLKDEKSRNVAKDLLVEAWGSWDDPEEANHDGCVNGLQCIYTGQSEDDAVGEAVDKSMRCLMTGASSPESSISASNARSSTSSAPALGYPAMPLPPTSPSLSPCLRCSSPSLPSLSSAAGVCFQTSHAAAETTNKRESSSEGEESASGTSGATGGEAPLGRGAALQGRHGGAMMEEMAASGNDKAVPLPNMLSLKPKTLNFSFSGMKSAFAAAVSKMGHQDEKAKCDFAASLQAAVFKHLEDQLRKTMWLYEFLEDFPRRLAVVGGVSCNETLRRRLRKLCESRGDTSVHEQEFKRLKNRLKILARRIPDSLLSQQVLTGRHDSLCPSSGGRHETSPAKFGAAPHVETTVLETQKRRGGSASFVESSDHEDSESSRQELLATVDTHLPEKKEAFKLHRVAHDGENELSVFEQGEKKKLRHQDRRSAEAMSPEIKKQGASDTDLRGILEKKLRAFSFAHYCRLRVDLNDLVSALKEDSLSSQETRRPIFFLSPEGSFDFDGSCSLGHHQEQTKGLVGEKIPGTQSTGAEVAIDGVIPKPTAPLGLCTRGDSGDLRRSGSRVDRWETFWTSKPLCNDNGVMIAWAAVNAVKCMDMSTGYSGAALTDVHRSEATLSQPDGKLSRRDLQNGTQTDADTDIEDWSVESEKRLDLDHIENLVSRKMTETLGLGREERPQQPERVLHNAGEDDYMSPNDGNESNLRNQKFMAAAGNDKKLVTPRWLGGISLCANDLLSKVEFLVLDWIVKTKSLP
ncbi:glycoprotease family protein [Toxoplasma gondii TgCatPRC2]|uniref:N(6)-L-threonylcarbamoyladenine synthase n=1 Tax=Toxoplasma gondii TgCatPRC2 TaxID=1130821 RepID=A0A151HPV0_TOXGO|nr:glycoprotease family protein [Toxoplasma gondii TgCatPRC2]